MKLTAMLDCSRNAVLNLETVKKFIDTLAKMNYKGLMLYTEDTYEVDNQPYFGYLRGRYSQEELKEISSYGALKGIEVIPCIQTLAHLNAIFRWGCYWPLKDYDDILLVGNDKVYELIEDMFSTLEKCFISRRVNIGMDEAHMLGRGRYQDINGVENSSDILLKHLNKVVEIAKKHGFKPMMWSDMFYRLATKGNYYDTSAKFDDNVKKLVPEGLVLIYWDYYHTDTTFYDKMIKGHKQFNNEIAFAGGICSWYGFTPQNEFAMKVSKAAISSCVRNNIDDVIITCWGDNGAECSFFATLPALFYVAKLAEGVTKLSTIKEEFHKVFGLNFDDFMKFEKINIPYKEYKPQTICTSSKYALYNDPFLGVFDSTIDETKDLIYQSHATSLKKCEARLGEYGYLASYYGSLAKVLQYKYKLGVLTRKYYKENNKEKLNELLSDYSNSIKYLKVFINEFRKAWYIENKPHGFDVQEIRLGGLLLRLESCKDRLKDYINGKINKIDELEETILNVDGVAKDKLNKTPTEFNSYSLSATVNII